MFNIFKNLPLKIFSLILAIIVWTIIVALQQTPYQFTEELDIKPFNLSEQLSIVTSLPKVKIKVVTSKEILSRLTKQDFEAYIDLKNIAKGTHTFPVSVAPKVSNVTVASIIPSQIALNIESVAQKQIPINVIAKGSPHAGFRLERLTPQQNTAQIKGAETLIKKIFDAKAIVYFDGTESENFQKEITLKTFDQTGAEIKETAITPAKIKVDIVISQTMHQKTVGIKAALRGSPKNGWVESVKIDPSSIEIKSAANIDAISYIETVQIDITDAEKTVEKIVPLNLPKEVSLVDESKNQVKVLIEIKPY